MEDKRFKNILKQQVEAGLLVTDAIEGAYFLIETAIKSQESTKLAIALMLKILDELKKFSLLWSVEILARKMLPSPHKSDNPTMH